MFFIPRVKTFFPEFIVDFSFGVPY